MTTSEQVTLTHPDLPDTTYNCAVSQAWVWESSGWKRADADAADAAPGTAPIVKPSAPASTAPAAAPALSKES